jgi:hypothetical protein
MGSARGGEYYISKPRWSSGKIYAPGDPSLGLKEDILFLETVNFYIFEGAAKLRWVGGAQRPVGRVNEPNKTGARSARARTRGQNPLVKKYMLTDPVVDHTFESGDIVQISGSYSRSR